VHLSLSFKKKSIRRKIYPKPKKKRKYRLWAYLMNCGERITDWLTEFSKVLQFSIKGVALRNRQK